MQFIRVHHTGFLVTKIFSSPWATFLEKAPSHDEEEMPNATNAHEIMLELTYVLLTAFTDRARNNNRLASWPDFTYSGYHPYVSLTHTVPCFWSHNFSNIKSGNLGIEEGDWNKHKLPSQNLNKSVSSAESWEF